ncbi:4-amino-4-deoxychorismate synthase [Sporobolomyces salmoneus]|uniref:4-amino-4-deoxychorismate synthase n=1 Tax=Sporobolomyces salmoneus TaxID=183962 RepID=UPI00316B0E32
MTDPRRIPTTLILDFHDSYTRNLLQLVERQADHGWDMTDWKERAIVINVDALSWNSFVADILPRFDCIVLGPGPGTPHSDEDFCWAKRLITEYGDKVPILGICLGCQGLATAFGGKVGTAATPIHGQISKIQHAGNPIFEGIPSIFSAVQFNSLVADPNSLPEELEVIATSDKGEVMGLAAKGKPLWGVQFHPESICSTYGTKILDNFFRLSLNHLQQSPSSSTPNLPPSILTLSTTEQPNRPPNRNSADLWERRTIELKTTGSFAPQRVFEQLIKGKSELGEMWLESARPTGVPQYSHLLNPESTLSYFASTHSIVSRSCSQPNSASSTALARSTTIFDHLSSVQTRLRESTSIQPCPLPSIPIGFVGYISYEMKSITMPLSRPTTERHEDELGKEEEPGTEFAFASKVMSYEHETGKWYASGLVRKGSLAEEEQEYGIDEEEWTTWISTLESYFSSSSAPRFTPISPVALPSTFTPDQTQPSYVSSIESARSSITLGNAYELCLTTQFRATLPPSSPLLSDPYPLYLSLRATNPAPYSAYFHLPKSGLTILSSSPERFLRSSSRGRVSMKPIKGTVRRCLDDEEEDERRKRSLEADEKERAENLMIVDLIRNDLLGFCEVESVEVEGLMQIETYETVHQMVTTVVGNLREGVTPFDAVSQAFPPGSMTGAPKLRSLQLLDELEQRRSRGIYSGVFGYVAVDGASDWSVVIRTLVKRGQELRLGAGGAITHLSNPLKEWEEVLTKIDAVLGTKKP